MDEQKPNIVIIMCDQLNFSRISCNGGDISTPNIDRLAQEGILYDNIMCTTPMCTPTRASIVTGKYPHNHKIVSNVWKNEYPWFKNVPSTEEGIKEKDVTTERILYNSGYDTNHIGKWHLKGEKLPYYTKEYREHYEYTKEMKNEFDKIRQLPRKDWIDWYGWALPISIPDKVQKAIDKNNGRDKKIKTHPFTEKIGLLKMEISKTFDYRVKEKTIKYLENKKEPFMLTCSFNIPHDPNVVPYEYYGKYKSKEVSLPENYEQVDYYYSSDLSRKIVQAYEESYVKEFLSIYYSSIMMLDDFVGEIMQAIDENTDKENTITIFMSDHGDMAGSHGMVWKSTKAFYDEIARQSLIIRYPKKLKPKRCNKIGSAVDIMPTILDLCDIKVPKDIDGQSLISKDDKSDANRYVLCERIDANKKKTREIEKGNKASFMIRGSRWKYITYDDGKKFLYDMKEDPGEKNNLYNDKKYEHTKEMLHQQMTDLLKETKFRYNSKESCWISN